MIRGVPYDAELEYLESTGKQWIDTGIVIPLEMSFEAVIELENPLMAQKYITGAWTVNNGGNGAIIRTRVGGIEIGTGQYTAQIDGIFPESGYLTLNISATTKTIICNGVSYDTVKKYATAGTTPPNTFTLFGCNFRIPSYILGPISGRIKSWKFIDSNGKAIMYLIPVRIGTTGYMYDRVSKKLFGNLGTGNFVLGPDKSIPLIGLHFYPKPKPTAKDYIQNGLVAMWDGIENAGWGAHDPNATTWTELVSGIAVNLANANAIYGWGDDCLIVSAEASSTTGYIMNFANSALNSQLNKALAYTVEIVAVKTDSDTSSRDQWLFSTENNPFLLQSYRTTSAITFYTNNNTELLSISTDVRIPFTASVSQIKSGGKTLYLNGVYKNSNNTETNPTFASIRITNRGGEKKRFNIRIYSRALTAEEIAYNYNIDKERFKLP